MFHAVSKKSDGGVLTDIFVSIFCQYEPMLLVVAFLLRWAWHVTSVVYNPFFCMR